MKIEDLVKNVYDIARRNISYQEALNYIVSEVMNYENSKSDTDIFMQDKFDKYLIPKALDFHIKTDGKGQELFFGRTFDKVNGQFPIEVIKQYANMYNLLVEEGYVNKGCKVRASAIDLARIGPEERVMLYMIPYSDYTREELNDILGFNYFTMEGELPPYWEDN